MAGEPVVLASVRQQVPRAAIANGVIICKAKLEVELPKNGFATSRFDELLALFRESAVKQL